MNKIWLIIQREFLSRVQKKSFLIATIVVPLIFPAIIALLVFISKESEKHTKKEVIYYLDESGIFRPDTIKYIFKPFSGSLEDAGIGFELVLYLLLGPFQDLFGFVDEGNVIAKVLHSFHSVCGENNGAPSFS